MNKQTQKFIEFTLTVVIAMTFCSVSFAGAGSVIGKLISKAITHSTSKEKWVSEIMNRGKNIKLINQLKDRRGHGHQVKYSNNSVPYKNGEIPTVRSQGRLQLEEGGDVIVYDINTGIPSTRVNDTTVHMPLDQKGRSSLKGDDVKLADSVEVGYEKKFGDSEINVRHHFDVIDTTRGQFRLTTRTHYHTSLKPANGSGDELHRYFQIDVQDGKIDLKGWHTDSQLNRVGDGYKQSYNIGADVKVLDASVDNSMRKLTYTVLEPDGSVVRYSREIEPFIRNGESGSIGYFRPHSDPNSPVTRVDRLNENPAEMELLVAERKVFQSEAKVLRTGSSDGQPVGGGSAGSGTPSGGMGGGKNIKPSPIDATQ